MAGKLIVISNRIPSEAAPSGGLVFALHETLSKIGGIWIGAHPDLVNCASESLSEYGEQADYARMSFSITREDYENFYLGFCITCHCSQGKTFDKPYTIYDWKMFDKTAKYVALSRTTKMKKY